MSSKRGVSHGATRKRDRDEFLLFLRFLLEITPTGSSSVSYVYTSNDLVSARFVTANHQPIAVITLREIRSD